MGGVGAEGRGKKTIPPPLYPEVAVVHHLCTSISESAKMHAGKTVRVQSCKRGAGGRKKGIEEMCSRTTTSTSLSLPPSNIHEREQQKGGGLLLQAFQQFCHRISYQIRIDRVVKKSKGLDCTLCFIPKHKGRGGGRKHHRVHRDRHVICGLIPNRGDDSADILPKYATDIDNVVGGRRFGRVGVDPARCVIDSQVLHDRVKRGQDGSVGHSNIRGDFTRS
mmetsp:Transcript_10374/g.27185  ORF Transcript_10374/g.27185 Transcript_10374/m.27185 type:complete len:221 (-) Transcript_10374:947-1609(-)